MEKYISERDAIQVVWETGDITVDEAKRRVALIPAADVVPVVHSVWRNNALGRVSCNRCDQSAEHASMFCPHCGARMDGQEGSKA